MADIGLNNHHYRDVSYEPPVFTSPQFNSDYSSGKAFGTSATNYPVQETSQPESKAFLPSQSPRSSFTSQRHHIKRIPWLGFIALTCSGATVIGSLIVLLTVNRHVVWPNSGWSAFMRPASWLSALLSANGIFLHFALEEGVTVAWWYRASKPDATVRELHDAWHHGTSLPAALFAGRRITYISMATIFCALLPLNGFLLQGAISTVLSQVTSEVSVYIPMVQQLPSGYSGKMLSNGNIDILNTAFGDVWVQVLNLEASPNAGYAFAGSFVNGTEFWDWGCDNSSICTTIARGAGFNVTCAASKISYDLTPWNGVDTYGNIFKSGFSWYPTDANTIIMELTWKDDSSCQGNLEHRICTAQAAIMEYPVQIQMNISSTNVYPGPFVSLVTGTTRKDDSLYDILPVATDDGVEDTIYGGIAAMFGMYFDSEMNITTNGNGSGTYYPWGTLSTSLSPGIPENMNHATNKSFNGYCNMSYEFGLQAMRNAELRDRPFLDPEAAGNIYDLSNNVDLADVILEKLRHAMFLASVNEGFSWFPNATDIDLGATIVNNNTLFEDYVQKQAGIQVTPVSRYTVRFYLWGASLAVTYIIILFLIPLFWGFWTLKRKPTMSPVDLARAFKAPLLSDYDGDETKTLLKQHGRRSIHYDLVSSPDSFRRENSGTQQSYFDMTSPRSQV